MILRSNPYGGVISVNIGRGQLAIPSVRRLSAGRSLSLSLSVSLPRRKIEVVAGPTRARVPSTNRTNNWTRADERNGSVNQL